MPFDDNYDDYTGDPDGQGQDPTKKKPGFWGQVGSSLFAGYRRPQTPQSGPMPAGPPRPSMLGQVGQQSLGRMGAIGSLANSAIGAVRHQQPSPLPPADTSPLTGPSGQAPPTYAPGGWGTAAKTVSGLGIVGATVGLGLNALAKRKKQGPPPLVGGDSNSYGPDNSTVDAGWDDDGY